MPSATWGMVSAFGSDAEIALTRAALDMADNAGRLPQPVESIPVRAWEVHWHSADDFLAKGYTLPSGAAAWGFKVGRGKLWGNSNLAAKHPFWAKYMVLHELGHAIAADLLSDADKAALLPMMIRTKDGEAPTAWRSGSYRDQPAEIYADAWFEAITGKRGPLDDYYGDIPDKLLPKVLELTLTTDPPAEPDPDPDVGPVGPEDPVVAELELVKGELAEVSRQLAVTEAALAAAQAQAQAYQQTKDGLVHSAGVFLMGLDVIVGGLNESIEKAKA